MRMVSLTGSTRVNDPLHGDFEAGPDGVFDLPHTFADHLRTNHRGHWRAEDELAAERARQELSNLRDPTVLLAAVSRMQRQIAELYAGLAEQGEQLAVLESRLGDAVLETSPEELVADSAQDSDEAATPTPPAVQDEDLAGAHVGGEAPKEADATPPARATGRSGRKAADKPTTT